MAGGIEAGPKSFEEAVMAIKTDRRQFLQRSVQGGLGATLAMSGLASPRKAAAASDKVVLGFIGVGGRGTEVLRMFLERPDVDMTYV